MAKPKARTKSSAGAPPARKRKLTATKARAGAKPSRQRRAAGRPAKARRAPTTEQVITTTTTVRVPEPFAPLFRQAECYVDNFFTQLVRAPTRGTIHVGDQRYVLVRAESLFAALYDNLSAAFGDVEANELIYNMARVIGRADCEAFSRERQLTDPNARLSTGPVHFAYTGWALVDILPTSRPAADESYLLHYHHPNTFESEAYRQRCRVADHPVCFFSAGYSAGWCSAAYGVEVHARELRCTARGDAHCEFIMAPFAKLEAHQQALAGGKP